MRRICHAAGLKAWRIYHISTNIDYVHAIMFPMLREGGWEWSVSYIHVSWKARSLYLISIYPLLGATPVFFAVLMATSMLLPAVPCIRPGSPPWHACMRVFPVFPRFSMTPLMYFSFWASFLLHFHGRNACFPI